MTKAKAQLIPPDAYPQMLDKASAARAMQTLRSAVTQVKARVAMEAQVPPMRAAILGYVAELESAGADLGTIYEKVHDIRGFAETAGLATTGRISDILCRYMDDMLRLGKLMDAQLVALHVAAIVRAARAEDDDERMGAIVAAELASLVARRLHEASRSQARA